MQLTPNIQADWEEVLNARTPALEQDIPSLSQQYSTARYHPTNRVRSADLDHRTSPPVAPMLEDATASSFHDLKDEGDANAVNKTLGPSRATPLAAPTPVAALLSASHIFIAGLFVRSLFQLHRFSENISTRLARVPPGIALIKDKLREEYLLLAVPMFDTIRRRVTLVGTGVYTSIATFLTWAVTSTILGLRLAFHALTVTGLSVKGTSARAWKMAKTYTHVSIRTTTTFVVLSLSILLAAMNPGVTRYGTEATLSSACRLPLVSGTAACFPYQVNSTQFWSKSNTPPTKWVDLSALLKIQGRPMQDLITASAGSISQSQQFLQLSTVMETVLTAVELSTLENKEELERAFTRGISHVGTFRDGTMDLKNAIRMFVDDVVDANERFITTVTQAQRLEGANYWKKLIGAPSANNEAVVRAYTDLLDNHIEGLDMLARLADGQGVSLKQVVRFVTPIHKFVLRTKEILASEKQAMAFWNALGIKMDARDKIERQLELLKDLDKIQSGARQVYNNAAVAIRSLQDDLKRARKRAMAARLNGDPTLIDVDVLKVSTARMREAQDATDAEDKMHMKKMFRIDA